MYRKTFAVYACFATLGALILSHRSTAFSQVANETPAASPAASAVASPTPTASPTKTVPPPVVDAENPVAVKKAQEAFPEFPTRPPSLLIHYIGDALNKVPFISLLCILILVDIVMGSLAALATKKLSSNVSWRGMCKKAASMLIVGTASAVEPLMGFPLAKFVALFYVWTETISIVEAAAALGVPLPPQLLSALIKLRETDRFPLQPAGAQPQGAGTTVIVRGNATIAPPRGSTVATASGETGGQERTDAIDRNTAATRENTAAVQGSAGSPDLPPSDPSAT